MSCDRHIFTVASWPVLQEEEEEEKEIKATKGGFGWKERPGVVHVTRMWDHVTCMYDHVTHLWDHVTHVGPCDLYVGPCDLYVDIM